MLKSTLNFTILTVAVILGTGTPLLASSQPFLYRCELKGTRTAIGNLIVSDANLASGGSELNLSDTPALGDIANEFFSASIQSFFGSGGTKYLSIVLSQHEPGQKVGSLISNRQVIASQAPILAGTPTIRVSAMGTFGEATVACNLVTRLR